MSATDKIKLSNTIVTVGKFDGLHKGHEKLLSELAKKANGRRKVVLTFAAEPKDVLNNQTSILNHLISTFPRKEPKRLLKNGAASCKSCMSTTLSFINSYL